ncbi:MAG: cyclic nucleotide-binding domain-containing protein, partial [Gammaproteobacteria bacterium]
MTNNVINFSEFRASCSKCNLYELCVPRGLNKVDIEKLNLIVRNTKNFVKGEYLFREGDVFNSFYAVKSGSVKLFIINENGDEQIIGFYFPGEILGFDALENEKHTCYAVALESASFCSMPYEKLHEICLELPELQKQMFRLMGREFSNENKMLLNINNNTAEQRIVIFLLSLSKRFQRLGYSAKSFNLTM